MLGLHTPPNDAAAEIMALGQVLGWAADTFPDADAVLLMGDFNADGSYFPQSSGGWPALMASSASMDSSSSSDILTVGELYTLLSPDGQDSTVAVSSNGYDRLIATTTWYEASVAAGGQPTALPWHYDTDPAMSVALAAVISEGCSSDGNYFAGSADREAACAAVGADTTEDKRLAAVELSDHYPLEFTTCILAEPEVESEPADQDPTDQEPADQEPADQGPADQEPADVDQSASPDPGSVPPPHVESGSPKSRVGILALVLSMCIYI
eukprot:SAG31_NODE_3334_length_4394_cov_2.169034_4_plen_268_part_00